MPTSKRTSCCPQSLYCVVDRSTVIGYLLLVTVMIFCHASDIDHLGEAVGRACVALEVSYLHIFTQLVNMINNPYGPFSKNHLIY
jgi:hypothetical protein